jgi:hypothetical protein
MSATYQAWCVLKTSEYERRGSRSCHDLAMKHPRHVEFEMEELEIAPPEGREVAQTTIDDVEGSFGQP